jgi:murein DD-endopeptidase MepM/ murein hydrolase activator NlpD
MVQKQQQQLQSKIEALIMAEQDVIAKERERARLKALALQRERQRRLLLARQQEARRLELQRQEARRLELQRLDAKRQEDERQRLAALERRNVTGGSRQSGKQEPGTAKPEAAAQKQLPEVSNLDFKFKEPLKKERAVSDIDLKIKEPSPREPAAAVKESREEPLTPPQDVTAIEIEKVSADFDRTTGTLPWPVKNGVVVRKFGTVKDKDLKIVTTSNGIDISVPLNSPVKAVSGGKVVQITYLPTFGNIVIIRHPNAYLTVYANLARVSVAKGEIIGSQHTIGSSGAMQEGGSIVHFEVWKGKTKQNPENWLRR